MAGGMGGERRLPHRQRRSTAEILRARDVPLPVGAPPHGPCAQLRDGRRRRPLQARQAASTCCTRWAGTPSACRPRTPPWSAASTRRPGPTRTSPTMRDQLKPLGLSLDWTREFATCDPDYYRQQQAMFLDFLEARPGLSQGEPRQLGPGRPHRAGQRAGGRRPRLALGRAGREARAEPVVLPHHRLRRRPADGAGDRSTAGRTRSG